MMVRGSEFFLYLNVEIAALVYREVQKVQTTVLNIFPSESDTSVHFIDVVRECSNSRCSSREGTHGSNIYLSLAIVF